MRAKFIDAVCKIWRSLHFDVTADPYAFISCLLHSFIVSKEFFLQSDDLLR